MFCQTAVRGPKFISLESPRLAISHSRYVVVVVVVCRKLKLGPRSGFLWRGLTSFVGTPQAVRN
jgi:hypothetical protein